MEAKLHLELQSINTEMQDLQDIMDIMHYKHEYFDTIYEEWKALEKSGKRVVKELQKVIRERG